MDFHTIPSILKLYSFRFGCELRYNFHTIPSILKRSFLHGSGFWGARFPYDSVYFKAVIVLTQRFVRSGNFHTIPSILKPTHTCIRFLVSASFPYDSVYFKALLQRTRRSLYMTHFHTIPSILKPKRPTGDGLAGTPECD